MSEIMCKCGQPLYNPQPSPSYDMLDPHARPPDFIRQFYKRIQKLKSSNIISPDNQEICDFVCSKENALKRFVEKEESLDSKKTTDAFNSFLYDESEAVVNYSILGHGERGPHEKIGQPLFRLEGLELKVYESKDIPGLQIIPSVLPNPIQRVLLSRTLHRYLSNPQHNNNANLHHRVSLPSQYSSYFEIPPFDVDQSKDIKTDGSTKTVYAARNQDLHRPLSHKDFLNGKLRWVTLGAQYDWTRKVYPSNKSSDNTSTSPHAPLLDKSTAESSAQQCPSIPTDIANLLKALYPLMRSDAAIVNVYSPGDVLGIHRDVSEESDVGLVSISLGCEAIFVVGLDNPPENDTGSADDCSDAQTKHTDTDVTAATQIDKTGQKRGASGVIALRLRSGDVVIMSGKSRWAWHGVPAVLPGTCPPELADWPVGAEEDVKSHSLYDPDPDVNVAMNSSCRLQIGKQECLKTDKYSQEPREAHPGWKGWMATKRVNLNVRQL